MKLGSRFSLRRGAQASVVVLNEVGSRPGEMSSPKRAFARETCLHASSGEES
ncbi:hypothetical protein DEO72_LG11g1806 [Vigna unguiculata]|uniref:Uncharacterized protein n=1 Tax=Vigna unguiculata TaxID=3917 RepID=A0A4D6NLV5_VIGUN|nr:hypothetical protein DEO72_LG11g1806 [Vigna unguiculata]